LSHKHDQSYHLRMETDITREIRAVEVLAALLPRQQAMMGGHNHWLSEIGCWWFGALVQLSWLPYPLRDTESGLLVFILP
uniref:Uncharacterized protein n=1 Tax=Monopterus albus TaxID=43700 RepID=A0A3Q3II45_MONAL